MLVTKTAWGGVCVLINRRMPSRIGLIVRAERPVSVVQPFRARVVKRVGRPAHDRERSGPRYVGWRLIVWSQLRAPRLSIAGYRHAPEKSPVRSQRFDRIVIDLAGVQIRVAE